LVFKSVLDEPGSLNRHSGLRKWAFGSLHL